jgi:hypothetical protein
MSRAFRIYCGAIVLAFAAMEWAGIDLVPRARTVYEPALGSARSGYRPYVGVGGGGGGGFHGGK